MKKQKVWVVLGASNGLGAAAVKYLTLNQQRVVAVILDDPAAPEICEVPESLKIIHVDTSNIQELGGAIKFLKGRYGPIDFIINNSNYKLFSDTVVNKNYDQIQNNMSVSIGKTIDLLKEILPFFREFPEGNIISIPPQLCLASVEDKTVADILSSSMDAFLKTLQIELQRLDCTLTFLEPGERMNDFTV